MPRVFVKYPGLLSMIVSSVEVYKKETFGILLGKKRGKDFFVNYAVNFQSASRHYDYVSIDALRENRIANTVRYVTNEKYIGDFHSHSGNFEKPSKHDLKDMVSQGSGRVFILVVVKNAKRPHKWLYNSREKSISGSLGKKFFVKLFAFHVRKKDSKVEKLSIKASSHLKKFNSLARHYGKLEEKLEIIEKQFLKHFFTKKKLKQKLSSFK